jgi:DNA-binding transcriptional LysR family regulator
MSNRRLEPDLLRTFVTIVDEGGFSRAAERVGRTQSAVSMQMHRLEETVGHPLFHRGRPHARLTPKGEALLAYARRLLSLQDEAIAALCQAPPEGAVRFGIPDDYATGLLPQILGRFGAAYARIELELRCETSPRLVELLSEGALDLAVITRGPGRPAGRFLRHEPLVWATSARRPLTGRDPLPVAVFQPECVIRQHATHVLTAAGRPHRIAYSSPNLAALVAVVETGLAVAALPASSVPDTLKVLRERDGMPALPSLELGLIRAHDAPLPAADALADCVVAAAEG